MAIHPVILSGEKLGPSNESSAENATPEQPRLAAIARPIVRYAALFCNIDLDIWNLLLDHKARCVGTLPVLCTHRERPIVSSAQADSPHPGRGQARGEMRRHFRTSAPAVHTAETDCLPGVIRFE